MTTPQIRIRREQCDTCIYRANSPHDFGGHGADTTPIQIATRLAAAGLGRIVRVE